MVAGINKELKLTMPHISIGAARDVYREIIEV